jgi:hypothetical protein
MVSRRSSGFGGRILVSCVALACIVLAVGACGGESRRPAPGATVGDPPVKLSSVVSRHVPSDLTERTDVEGPLDPRTSGSPGFDISVGTIGGKGLAVMRTSGHAVRGGPAEPVQRAGPRGLRACRVGAGGGGQVLALSRSLPVERLCELADASRSSSIANFERDAHLSHSPVPGIGSLPVPPDATFSATSFTTPEGIDPQRSVAVATFRGGREVLDVLSWWYGAGQRVQAWSGALEFGFPALAVPDGQEEVTDEARLLVAVEDGRVSMARLTGLTRAEEAEVIDALEP